MFLMLYVTAFIHFFSEAVTLFCYFDIHNVYVVIFRLLEWMIITCQLKKLILLRFDAMILLVNC